jgi:hypothetical protein
MKGWIRNAIIVAVILVCVGTPLLMHNIQLARDPQLKILREMTPYWNRAESGGIVLIAEPPNERAMVTYPALVASPADGSDDSHFEEKWGAALPGLIDKLDHFFQDAHLEPGTYTFANQYYPLIKSGELKGGSIPLNSDSDELVIPIPLTENVTFTVTQDHLKLLRHMNTRRYQADIEIMDPKRPYGGMTYFFIDMAAALGRPLMRDRKGDPQLSRQEVKDYQRLHGEMLWAVTAFLRYAKL